MALTLNTSDYNKLIGTHTDNIIRATSTLWNYYSDFNYIVEISPINFTFNGNSNLTFYIKPRPTDGLMVFNLSEALKNVVYPIGVDYSNFSTDYIYQNELAGRKINLKVYEYYNGSIQSSSTDQTFYIIYSSYFKAPLLYYLPNSYSIYDTIGTKYFNVGRNILFRFHKRQPINSLSTVGYKILIYSNSGSLITTLDNSNSLKNMEISSTDSKPLNLYTLDNSYVEDLSNTTLDSLIDLGDYFIIQEYVIEGSTTYTNNSVKYYNTHSCFDDGVILYFLNEYGQFEHFYFPHYKESIDVDVSNFEVSKYDMTTGDFRLHDEFERMASNVSTNYLNIKTDLISDDSDFEVLKRILTSPVIYMNFVSDSEPIIYKVTLTDVKYNVLRRIYDKTKQISLNIRFGRQINL